MSYLILPLVLFALWFSFRYRWWSGAVDYGRPRILMYHMIRDPVPGTRFNGLRVAPDQFARQLAWLRANGWSFMTLNELTRLGASVPEKSVVLTFDDGYADNFTNALPIMRQYGAKGTLFLVDQREHNDWSTKKKAHHDSGELAEEPKLSDEQVRELLASGMFELGAHTFTHPNLPTLGEQERAREIIDIKAHFEARYGVPVTSFAYPFGIFDATDVALAGKAGYTAAVTTNPGIDAAFWLNPLELSRVKISGKEGLFAFKIRIKTGKRGLTK